MQYSRDGYASWEIHHHPINDVEMRHSGDREGFSSYNGVKRETLSKSLQWNPSSINIRKRASPMSQLMVAFKGCDIDYSWYATERRSFSEWTWYCTDFLKITEVHMQILHSRRPSTATNGYRINNRPWAREHQQSVQKSLTLRSTRFCLRNQELGTLSRNITSSTYELECKDGNSCFHQWHWWSESIIIMWVHEIVV